MENTVRNKLYEERHKEGIRRKEVTGYLYMLDRLDKETSPNMLTFNHETHVIRIEDEKHGFLTVTIKSRKPAQMLHKIRFRKKPGLGVVYQFRNAERLNYLAATAETLEKLNVA